MEEPDKMRRVFGEEIPSGTGSRTAPCFTAADTLTQKFTGKERDAETGLDYFGARYFSGPQGRFTSPDPLMASAKTTNPQSWNHDMCTR
jgi:RHS repeat-associated protein